MSRKKQPKVANNAISTVTESTETNTFKLKQVTREELIKVRFLPYTKKCFSDYGEELLNTYPPKYYIAVGDNNLVKGCIVYSYMAHLKRIHIYMTERVSCSKGKGYGSKLFEALENHIIETMPPRKVKVITLRCVKELSKFWKLQGFEPALDTDMDGYYVNSGLAFYSKQFEHKSFAMKTAA